MKHLIMNCLSEICEYEIRMPLLPLAGTTTSPALSRYRLTMQMLPNIYNIYLKCNILHITGKCLWVSALPSAGIFQLCKCGQSYTYLKCNILHITGTSNYANGAEGILDNNDPQCWWGKIIFATQGHTWYLSFFLHEQNFWRIKFTPKSANFSR